VVSHLGHRPGRARPGLRRCGPHPPRAIPWICTRLSWSFSLAQDRVWSPFRPRGDQPRRRPRPLDRRFAMDQTTSRSYDTARLYYRLPGRAHRGAHGLGGEDTRGQVQCPRSGPDRVWGTYDTFHSDHPQGDGGFLLTPSRPESARRFHWHRPSGHKHPGRTAPKALCRESFKYSLETAIQGRQNRFSSSIGGYAWFSGISRRFG